MKERVKKSVRRKGAAQKRKRGERDTETSRSLAIRYRQGEKDREMARWKEADSDSTREKHPNTSTPKSTTDLQKTSL